jgi:predicted carbohydrate-binding protein with CBM5 and CBM33 domain
VVVFMALASIAGVIYQTAQLKRATGCYLRLAQDTATALRARDADSAQARVDAITYTKASADLWQGFLSNAPSPGQIATPAQRDASLKVLSQYFVANRAYVASLERVRLSAEHYPLPSSTC